MQLPDGPHGLALVVGALGIALFFWRISHHHGDDDL